jgi:hypothetical protein
MSYGYFEETYIHCIHCIRRIRRIRQARRTCKPRRSAAF